MRLGLDLKDLRMHRQEVITTRKGKIKVANTIIFTASPS
jgi:hypothetical protein